MSRRLIHLAGNPAWAREQVRLAVGAGRESRADRAERIESAQQSRWRVLWIGEGAPQQINSSPASDYQRILGTTQDIIVFDAHPGLDPDALAAASGALRGGGILVLLTPEPGVWSGSTDAVMERLIPAGRSSTEAGSRFIQRLLSALETTPWVECYRPGDTLPRLNPGPAPALEVDELGCCSSDQRAAVETLRRVVTGHRRRPVVLSADRGRGKSAALGIAAGALLAAQRVSSVVVTAPRLTAAEPVLEHAEQHWGGERVGRRTVRIGLGEINYRAAEELVAEQLDADLLIVDEAAGLPVALLSSLLRSMARIAFATTVHGYEGTGRGFDLRFRSVLDSETPEWRLQRLEQPVRWLAGDRLEAWLADVLLLDAEIATLAKDLSSTASIQSRLGLARVERDALAKDDKRLRQAFGLLVAAHYRTRPLDLRQWLDAPGIELYWALLDTEVVGIVVAAEEGGLSADLAAQVWNGRRRLRGHLLSQMLATHGGVERAPTWAASRILRIAVHPQLRRCGVGRCLVGIAQQQARQAGCSLLGTSFGATPDLLDFWVSCGMASVAVGIKRDAASGEHAVVMAKGLDQVGLSIVSEASERLGATAEALLGEPLSRLEPRLARSVFAAVEGGSRPRLPAWQRRDLIGFAYGQRGYAASLPALKGLTTLLLVYPGLTERQGRGEGQTDVVAALLAKVLQHKDWHSVAPLLGCQGRSAGLSKLRHYVARLLERLV